MPVPAQFLKLLGQASAKNTADLFHYQPVSKWNIEPSQGLSNEFLQRAWARLEAQEKAALASNAAPPGPDHGETPTAPASFGGTLDLKRDSRLPTATANHAPPGENDWKPAWRIEMPDGKKVLRFLWADPVSSDSCVACHNAYEQTPEIMERRKCQGLAAGKQWRRHQPLGALSITIPLDKVEAMAESRIRSAFVWIVGVLAISLGGAVLFGIRSVRQSRSLDALSWQATHDTLTGFDNRRGFDFHINRLRQSAAQERIRHTLCLIDLDGFKQINDTYGHQAGDELLRAIGKRLPGCLRDEDVIARLGGDEFAALMPGCTLGNGRKIAEHMRETLANVALPWKGESLRVSASIGLVEMDGSRPVEEVMAAADAACYAAKRAGKNRVVAYGEHLVP